MTQEGQGLPQDVTGIVADAAPVVTQEAEARQQLEEARSREMGETMRQLEQERDTKGNFCVTVGYEGDEEGRNVVFISPVKATHYSEFRHGYSPNQASSDAARPLEQTIFTFAADKGFFSVVLETESVPENFKRITGDSRVQHVADSLQGALADAARRDGRITIPAATLEGETGEKPFPIYQLMKPALETNSLIDDDIRIRFHDADRDPSLVVDTVKKSITEAQARHIKGTEQAKQATANVTQTAAAVRQELGNS